MGTACYEIVDVHVGTPSFCYVFVYCTEATFDKLCYTEFGLKLKALGTELGTALIELYEFGFGIGEGWVVAQDSSGADRVHPRITY